jgi:hypothetical protein
VGEGKPAAGVEQGAAAPWPELAGAHGFRDVEHKEPNQGHGGVVELAANSPKANMTSGRDSGAPATEEGGRRPWKAHRRALARNRKQ